jgi:hypothetical protein
LLNVKLLGKCVVRDNPPALFRHLLEENLFGQEHLIEPLTQMVENWHQRVQSRATISEKRVTTFHIAGDNGVGKTYAVSLLAKALFQYDTPDGFLLISGINYEGSDPDMVSSFSSLIESDLLRLKPIREICLMSYQINYKNVRAHLL